MSVRTVAYNLPVSAGGCPVSEEKAATRHESFDGFVRAMAGEAIDLTADMQTICAGVLP